MRFGRGHGRRGFAADRTGDLPVSALELSERAGRRMLPAVRGAAVGALAVDGLGAGHHDLARPQPLGHHGLEQEGGAGVVDAGEGAEVRLVVLIGGQMKHRVRVR